MSRFIFSLIVKIVGGDAEYSVVEGSNGNTRFFEVGIFRASGSEIIRFDKLVEAFRFIDNSVDYNATIITPDGGLSLAKIDTQNRVWRVGGWAAYHAGTPEFHDSFAIANDIRKCEILMDSGAAYNAQLATMGMC